MQSGWRLESVEILARGFAIYFILFALDYINRDTTAV
jgi:hypothetical protein